MSMNLYVEATIEAVTTANKKITVRKIFNLWQTPTEVTNKILSKESNTFIIEEYEKWCLSICNDLINEGNLTRNLGNTHIKELREWVIQCKENGYKIEFYSM